MDRNATYRARRVTKGFDDISEMPGMDADEDVEAGMRAREPFSITGDALRSIARTIDYAQEIAVSDVGTCDVLRQKVVRDLRAAADVLEKGVRTGT